MKDLFKSAVRRFLFAISEVFDKPLSPPTDREKELVEGLRDTFRGFTFLGTTNCSRSEKAWLDNQNRLRELVLDHDPREFLRWDVIQGTMFVTNHWSIVPELNSDYH